MTGLTRLVARWLLARLLARLWLALWPRPLTVAHTLVSHDADGWRIVLVEERRSDGGALLTTLALVEPGGRRLWLWPDRRPAWERDFSPN